jgi:hypothetical protein
LTIGVTANPKLSDWDGLDGKAVAIFWMVPGRTTGSLDLQKWQVLRWPAADKADEN